MHSCWNLKTKQESSRHALQRADQPGSCMHVACVQHCPCMGIRIPYGVHGSVRYSRDITMQDSARPDSLVTCKQWLHKQAKCQQAREVCTSMAVKSIWLGNASKHAALWVAISPNRQTPRCKHHLLGAAEQGSTTGPRQRPAGSKSEPQRGRKGGINSKESLVQ